MSASGRACFVYAGVDTDGARGESGKHAGCRNWNRMTLGTRRVMVVVRVAVEIIASTLNSTKPYPPFGIDFVSNDTNLIFI